MATMTTGGWMVYALAMSVLASAAGWLAEAGFARLRLPTRWVWLGALVVSLGVPVAGLLSARGEAGSADVMTSTVRALPGTASGAIRSESGPWPDALGALVARSLRTLERWIAAAAAVVPARGSAGAWLVGGWVAAALALAILLLTSAARLSTQVRGWPRRRLLGREVRVSPGLGPATVGLRRPQIVVPDWAAELPPHELELVLTHEEEHVRARDPAVLALGLSVAAVCPWNPLIWWQHRRLRDAVEVDCDRRVIRRGAATSGYGRLLVKVGCRARRHLLPIPTVTGSTSLLERRLSAMTSTTRASLPRSLAAFASALALLVIACGTEPPVATPEPGAVDAQAAQLERNELVADVWVEPDGSVSVNDEAHTMEEVSDVVGVLHEAAGGALVVSIAAAPGVPYHVMDALQRELQGSGATRVVFGESQSRPGPTPPGDPGEVTDGLAILLPTDNEAEQVSVRNILHLVVQPSGTVEVSRGRDPRVQRIRPADVEAVWRQEVAANSNLIAAVKTHPDASYTDMMGVLEALHAAHARRISLQTLEN